MVVTAVILGVNLIMSLVIVYGLKGAVKCACRLAPDGSAEGRAEGRGLQALGAVQARIARSWATHSMVSTL
ncbi:MAG: hypothetical protein JO321_13705 [Solirubrobacterales bacterium]|nr:hypothetical protein [Solirubrobacterales bacterium]MBV9536457.1 hypothetical protein [Solirubrobacterales bacterium]